MFHRRWPQVFLLQLCLNSWEEIRRYFYRVAAQHEVPTIALWIVSTQINKQSP
ncbi:uncharacterized protein BKA55DRAFT_579874 [Fusarium redolens]|uniref:Uncharacterized protein n=1 Tax=Fusarium redolens TaxID=48865 RepID=A0A9P9G9M5_FUSRE|nr:uncharacterized protein BKA55DRAFT_579874 [Fusarium redolens]KAH7233737.1 hypothetical protein BKA55DRAFT_579874 [Fusarium redolens]